MEIYLSDLQTGDTLRFPMAPESISVQTGAVFQSYPVLNIGDIKLPAGQSLTGFAWEGILPGPSRQKDPYIIEWRDPKEIQSLWSTYRAKKEKLHLLATGTPIDHDVYLDQYTVAYSGGQGDYHYSISFIQAKDLQVSLSGAGANGTNSSNAQSRSAPPAAKTYTVVKNDSLWAVAQKLLGDGSKYPQLYEANKTVIDPRNKQNPALSKYTIYPGQILTIPS